MPSDTEKKLTELIALHAEVEAKSITPDTKVDKTGIDSLGIAELIFDLEEHYDVTLESSEALSERFNLGTVRDLAAKLDKLLEQK